MTMIAETRQLRRVWLATFAVLTIVVVSVVPWRTGDIYAGGADPVVVAKALVGFLGFGGSVLLYWWAPVRGSIGIRSLTLLAGIVLIALIGAFAAGDASAAVVLTVRIVLVAATIVMVAKAAPPMVMPITAKRIDAGSATRAARRCRRLTTTSRPATTRRMTGRLMAGRVRVQRHAHLAPAGTKCVFK